MKDLVRQWCDSLGAWHYAPIQNGMGEHGIHDRVSCVPVIVTTEMVGKKIGLFISIESKKPGRRGEKDRGMSKHQQENLEEINAAGGLSICCDGQEDIDLLEARLNDLLNRPA